jgi:hypothetical protein
MVYIYSLKKEKISEKVAQLNENCLANANAIV